MKFTRYFMAMRQRPDRAMIQMEWIQRVVEHPEKEVVQQDGRIRRWARINGRTRASCYIVARRRDRS